MVRKLFENLFIVPTYISCPHLMDDDPMRWYWHTTHNWDKDCWELSFAYNRAKKLQKEYMKKLRVCEIAGETPLNSHFMIKCENKILCIQTLIVKLELEMEKEKELGCGPWLRKLFDARKTY